MLKFTNLDFELKKQTKSNQSSGLACNVVWLVQTHALFFQTVLCRLMQRSLTMQSIARWPASPEWQDATPTRANRSYKWKGFRHRVCQCRASAGREGGWYQCMLHATSLRIARVSRTGVVLGRGWTRHPMRHLMHRSPTRAARLGRPD
jgi:hypothetical protein